MRSIGLVLLIATFCFCQQPPRSSASSEDSSSKQTKIDLSPPVGSRPSYDDDDVQEMRPYDPHRAAKDVEVAQYHLKNKNYPAAESRLREALRFKPNDPEATILLARAYDKDGKTTQAQENYAAYLKSFPKGEHSEEAQRAIFRLKEKSGEAASRPTASKVK